MTLQLQVGRTFTQCIEKLEREAQILLDQRRQNTISFDWNKCELQHFTSAPRPEEYPHMTIDGSTFSANQVTRSLGLLLDRKLSFLYHTKHWAHKEIAVAAHLHRLKNTMKGSPTYLVRHIAKACVLPVVFFGSEA